MSKKFAYSDQFSKDNDLAPFYGDVKSYLIASTPRCGSHFLGHGLRDMGGFGVPLEYLNPGNIRGWKKRFGDKPLPELIDDFIRHRTSPNGLFGLKAHWSQFHKFSNGQKLSSIMPFTHVVHLYRSDVLGQAISFLKAEQTGQWISGTASSGTASFDYQKVVACAKRVRTQNLKWHTYLTKHYTDNVMRVEYSDLIKNQIDGLRDIAHFLDPNTTSKPVVSERTKRQSDTLSSLWRDQFLTELQDEDSWICEPFKL